ncbi:hypothetical protein CPLU01_05908 [Colletotrichum plurivorum]|uniref:Uncharacterized protein n=1 Tax=Colletotrichum plurivorum TaxID=2175906 RepID=A0A8H6NGS0_9PEZI|nr:hypothetical protein CPLU01_05908 [Colletotrichum plurivorum]
MKRGEAKVRETRLKIAAKERSLECRGGWASDSAGGCRRRRCFRWSAQHLARRLRLGRVRWARAAVPRRGYARPGPCRYVTGQAHRTKKCGGIRSATYAVPLHSDCRKNVERWVPGVWAARLVVGEVETQPGWGLQGTAVDIWTLDRQRFREGAPKPLKSRPAGQANHTGGTAPHQSRPGQPDGLVSLWLFPFG